MSFYLAFKEIWRNRGRFFLFSLVITLITTLVLFIAALAEGLAQSNKQYLEKLDAQLLIFQSDVQLSTSSSRVGFSKLNDIERIEGVVAAGPIGFSSGTLVFTDGREDLNVSLIGVEAGKPGSPPVIAGLPMETNRGAETVIDSSVANRAGVRLGDTITLKTIQGTEESFFNLKVTGISDDQRYLFQPSVFVPYRTWDQIKPQAAVNASLIEGTSNVVAVKIANPAEADRIHQQIHDTVAGVEVVDIKTAYEALPGYSVQQSTLKTQQGFTLLIGVLVIGGFFQIQMLQKIPQIGVLKAIGASNRIVSGAVVTQIILITTFGVLLGSLVTFLLALGIPDVVPVVFVGPSVALAIVSLLAIGPIGGLVSVRLAVKVEPLIALGLSS